MLVYRGRHMVEGVELVGEGGDLFEYFPCYNVFYDRVQEIAGVPEPCRERGFQHIYIYIYTYNECSPKFASGSIRGWFRRFSFALETCITLSPRPSTIKGRGPLRYGCRGMGLGFRV